MRGHMAISLFALVFGALETGGAVQELVYPDPWDAPEKKRPARRGPET
jgi:hypothetical protein